MTCNGSFWLELACIGLNWLVMARSGSNWIECYELARAGLFQLTLLS